MFKACDKLLAHHRLVLSGTPIVNRPDDAGSLFQFLKINPLGNANVFNQAIVQPVKRGEGYGLARLRAMMSHLTLRRTKKTVDIQLPSKTIKFTKIKWRDDIHREIHEAIFNSARESFIGLLKSQERVLEHYMAIFEVILRIRQSCCSGALIPLERREQTCKIWKELKERGGKPLNAREGLELLNRLRNVLRGAAEDGDNQASNNGSQECSICLEVIDEENASILRTCSHVFCSSCIENHERCSVATKECPLCRKEFVADDIKKMNEISKAAKATPEELSDEAAANETRKAQAIEVELTTKAPKILQLVKMISEVPEGEKIVIFSQWVKFINILESRLVAAGKKTCRIDGSMKAQDRIQTMIDFQSNDAGSPRIIFCSLHACGVGINLTRGNHIFLMDTWWNRAIEDQAMDRVYRIGQTRPVNVTKIIMEGSLEERIIGIQTTKSLLCKGSMEKLSPDDLRRLKVGMLKKLFDIPDEDDFGEDVYDEVYVV